MGVEQVSRGQTVSGPQNGLEEKILLIRDPADPDGPVLRWMAVRIETSDKLLLIKCHFFNQMDSQSFAVTYDADQTTDWVPASKGYEKALRVAGRCSSGDFVLPADFRGFRIGGWLMTHIIRWAQQWPDANIRPIWLSEVDAGADNLERRNRLWISCGFRFNHENPRSGTSLPMKARDLTCPLSWHSNITDITLDRYHEDVGREVLFLDQEIDTAFRKFQDINYTLKWLGDHPLRYALGRGWMDRCNPPVRKETYLEEKPGHALPDILPSSAHETLLSVFPVVRKRRDRLSHLAHMNETHARALTAIEAAPFGHVIGCLKDSLYLKLALGAAILTAVIWINL